MAVTPVAPLLALMAATIDVRLADRVLATDCDTEMASPLMVNVPEAAPLLLLTEVPETKFVPTEAETPLVELTELMAVALAMAEPEFDADESVSLEACEPGTVTPLMSKSPETKGLTDDPKELKPIGAMTPKLDDKALGKVSVKTLPAFMPTWKLAVPKDPLSKLLLLKLEALAIASICARYCV